jgi:hypothetical protein
MNVISTLVAMRRNGLLMMGLLFAAENGKEELMADGFSAIAVRNKLQ